MTWHIQFFGNGTTAIYACLRALRCAGEKVVLPATICPSVIAALFEAEATPSFVDIENDRFGLDPAALAASIRQVAAVIAVHQFGIPCRIAEIAEICERHNVPLIEDCAQAEGASVGDKPVGSFGDVAIYSFGAGKIISLGGGGSAETADDRFFEALEREHHALERSDAGVASDELSVLYKSIYNAHWPDGLAGIRADFTRRLRDFAPGLLARFSPQLVQRILDGRRSLAANVAGRLDKCETYRTALADLPGVSLMHFPQGSAPWRFNLILNAGTRQRVLKTLLRERYKVSSWYPEIASFLDPAVFESAGLSNSRWLTDRVLNLWVDGETTSAEIAAVSNRMTQLLAE